MRILCIETDRHAADTAVEQLRSAGHDVVGCYRDPDGPAWPCAGIDRPAACPLDDHRGADVALTVRRRPHPHPKPREAGVTCALRRGIPLVVAGNPSLNPFEWWTRVTVAGSDVAAACDRAARRARDDLGALVAADIRRLLERHDLPTSGVWAEVSRSGGDLTVIVHRPAAAAHLDHVTAVHTHRTLRDAGVASARISISHAA